MYLKSNPTKENVSKESNSPITAISTLPGVGPTLARRLQEAGFNSLESIATVSIGELMALGGLGEKTAGKIVQAAREKLG